MPMTLVAQLPYLKKLLLYLELTELHVFHNSLICFVTQELGKKDQITAVLSQILW